MMEFIIDKENDMWSVRVIDDSGKEVDTFELFEYGDIVRALKNTDKKFVIYDIYYGGEVRMDKGEVTGVYDEYEGRNKSLEKLWGYKRSQPEYDEPNCSNCGDGGCMWCEPHRFI